MDGVELGRIEQVVAAALHLSPEELDEVAGLLTVAAALKRSGRHTTWSATEQGPSVKACGQKHS